MQSLDRIARDVLDSLQEGCQVIGFDWKYLYVNDALVRQGQLSREQLSGRTMMECYPGLEDAPFFAVLRRCMETRTRDSVEIEFVLPDGKPGWFDLRIVPVPDGICILSLDTTEAKHAADRLARSEEQLRQSQKMEAVGVLAGGVAHDFNNMLSVILGESEMLLADLKEADPMRADVEQIQKAAGRAAELTRQLLTFSRQQVWEPKVLDLNELLTGMDKMLQRLLSADVQLVTKLPASLGHVRVDPGSIEQIAVNLVLNARDAMPRGGRITIETANVVLDEETARRHLGGRPGRYVMLSVTDSGSGMDKATQSRIFEPFFTTKPKGKGTGLGLSTVFGIVQQSGGSIWLSSAIDQGTTFRIYLPQIDDPMEALHSSDAPARLYGSETILLVEDDDQVRLVTAGILRRSGYHVIEAGNAGEALHQCETHVGAIDLLLSDVVMPQMSGPELATRLATIRPRMKVVCMSGYTGDSFVRHDTPDVRMAYLQKPITVATLTAKVRDVLDTPAAS